MHFMLLPQRRRHSASQTSGTLRTMIPRNINGHCCSNEFLLSLTHIVVMLPQRLQAAPKRIADIWNIAGLGLNVTGLSVVEAPQLTLEGQLAVQGVNISASGR